MTQAPLITPEMLHLIAQLDEAKGKWQVLKTLAQGRLGGPAAQRHDWEHRLVYAHRRSQALQSCEKSQLTDIDAGWGRSDGFSPIGFWTGLRVGLTYPGKCSSRRKLHVVPTRWNAGISNNAGSPAGGSCGWRLNPSVSGGAKRFERVITWRRTSGSSCTGAAGRWRAANVR